MMNEIMNVMCRAALQIEVYQGAVAVFYSGELKHYPLGQTVEVPDPRLCDSVDNGTNYIGCVWGMIAQSLRTGQPSGAFNVMKGEFPSQGSLISKDGWLIVAAIGGTEEQNIKIAQAGLDAY